jgi:hypothetical protein
MRGERRDELEGVSSSPRGVAGAAPLPFWVSSRPSSALLPSLKEPPAPPLDLDSRRPPSRDEKLRLESLAFLEFNLSSEGQTWSIRRRVQSPRVRMWTCA